MVSMVPLYPSNVAKLTHCSYKASSCTCGDWLLRLVVTCTVSLLLTHTDTHTYIDNMVIEVAVTDAMKVTAHQLPQ